MIPDWLEVTPLSGKGNGKLTITAGPNIGLDRSASVAVTDANGKTKALSVSQKGCLTVVADMVHPTQRMYTTIQSDIFYDNFNKIEKFDIGFSNYTSATSSRFLLSVDHFSEDGTNCFSETIPKETSGLLFPVKIVAVKLLSDNVKYIQLAPIHG